MNCLAIQLFRGGDVIFHDSHGAGDGIQAKNHEIIRCYAYGLSLATWLSYRVSKILSKTINQFHLPALRIV